MPVIIRRRPKKQSVSMSEEEKEEEFRLFSAIAERIDLAASLAADRASERDSEVRRHRDRSWLERQAFTSRLATHIFKVQNNGHWPMEEVREWLSRLGLEKEHIDDLEHAVALRRYRYLKKEGDERLILRPPEHPRKRRKRLRKE